MLAQNVEIPSEGDIVEHLRAIAAADRVKHARM